MDSSIVLDENMLEDQEERRRGPIYKILERATFSHFFLFFYENTSFRMTVCRIGV